MAIQWTNPRPTGDLEMQWKGLSLSADGSIMLAIGQPLIGGAAGTRLHRSLDGGDNWTEVQPRGDEGYNWQKTGMRNDGLRMVAGSTDGRLYFSSNTGDSWIERRPAGDVDGQWNEIGVANQNFNPFRVLAGGMVPGSHIGGRLYRTSDGGASWEETYPPGGTPANQNWRAVATDRSGSWGIACTGNQGRLYRTGGTTWVELQPAGDVNLVYWSGAVSHDTSTIVLGTSQRLFISHNGRLATPTWTDVQPSGVNRVFLAVACSGDGQTIIAAEVNGRVHLSTDGGTTWAEEQPAGDLDWHWRWAAVSDDGYTFMLGAGLQPDHSAGDLWIGKASKGIGAGSLPAAGSLSGAGEAPVVPAAEGSGLVAASGALVGAGDAPVVPLASGLGSVSAEGDATGAGKADKSGYGSMGAVGGPLVGAGEAPGLVAYMGFGHVAQDLAEAALVGEGLAPPVAAASGSGQVRAIATLDAAGLSLRYGYSTITAHGIVDGYGYAALGGGGHLEASGALIGTGTTAPKGLGLLAAVGHLEGSGTAGTDPLGSGAAAAVGVLHGMGRTPTNIMRVWDGFAWVTGTLRYWGGSSWLEGSLKRWNGDEWVGGP